MAHGSKSCKKWDEVFQSKGQVQSLDMEVCADFENQNVVEMKRECDRVVRNEVVEMSTAGLLKAMLKNLFQMESNSLRAFWSQDCPNSLYIFKFLVWSRLLRDKSESRGARWRARDNGSLVLVALIKVGRNGEILDNFERKMEKGYLVDDMCLEGKDISMKLKFCVYFLNF